MSALVRAVIVGWPPLSFYCGKPKPTEEVVAVGIRTCLAVLTAVGTVVAVAAPAPATPRGWARVVPVRNVVASSPVAGGGYPDPGGAPVPGTCASGMMNSNRSESWVAVKPGTEDLVGTSKFFFD